MSKWEMVRLGDVCELTNGYAFDSVYFNTDGKGMPIIRIRDVVRGFTETYTVESCREEYVIKKGDLLIGMDGEFNIAPWNSDDALLNQRVCKIESSSAKLINPYLYYYLPKALKLIEEATSFVTVKHLSSKKINDISIPLPPLPVQQQIADVLDRASALIEKRKAQIEMLDLLVKSRFIEMFGDLGAHNVRWPDSTIEELCKKKDDIKCGPFGTQLSKDEYKNEGVPLWGIPQINASFTMPPTDFLDDKKASQLDSYSILPNDIVMSRKGNVGKCALYPQFGEKGIMHSDVLRIRIDCDKVSPVFLMHQLHYSNYVQQQILVVSSGAIMAGINVTKLKTIRVHSPSLSLQTQFADFVHQVESHKSLLKQSLIHLEQNYKSLMQKCFRGEIF